MDKFVLASEKTSYYFHSIMGTVQQIEANCLYVIFLKIVKVIPFYLYEASFYVDFRLKCFKSMHWRYISLCVEVPTFFTEYFAGPLSSDCQWQWRSVKSVLVRLCSAFSRSELMISSVRASSVSSLRDRFIKFSAVLSLKMYFLILCDSSRVVSVASDKSV